MGRIEEKDMIKDLVETMLLDINRTTRNEIVTRDEYGTVVNADIPLEELIKAMEIYDWSIEKELRRINWEGLKEVRAFKKST